MSSSPIRTMFDDRLRNKLYSTLKNSSEFRNVDVSVLIKFVDDVLAEKQVEITTYLRDYKVTISSMDGGVNWVINKMLIPFINEMRVY